MPCLILLYADDMVIFEKSREQMRAVLAAVHRALPSWRTVRHKSPHHLLEDALRPKLRTPRPGA